MWHGVANGIRHVDGSGARFDGSLEDAAQVVPIAASGILCRELDGRAEIASVGNHGLDLLERLLGTQLQLILKVNIRGCKKDVDDRLLSSSHALPGSIDIALIGARKPGDSGAPVPAGDLLDRFEVTGRSGGETPPPCIPLQPRKLRGN